MANTCVVTATITDPSQTSLLGNAFVKFQLRNFTGFVPQVQGSNVVCEDTIVAYPNPAGSISQVLVCNTAISPENTFYTAEFWNQGRIVSSANYYFNANTSLNTVSNINPAPAPTGPSSIVFENNGILNSSQTLLNLTSTTITIQDLGGGRIDLEAGSTGLSGNGAYFVGPGISALNTIYAQQSSGGLGGGVFNSAAGVVQVYLFELQIPYTISKASIEAIGSQINVDAYFGIYGYSGNLLVNAGTFLNLSSSGVQTNSFSPVTLPAGTYWHAQATNTSDTGQFPAIIVADATVSAALTKNATRAATAANAASGSLPLTLGALTPFVPSSSNSDIIMCPVYE